jgi:hypothetical protein
MTFKHMFSKSIAAFGLGCLSTFAVANELTIINNTHQDSTCRIIKKKSQKCTDSMVGGKGITRAGQPNSISESNIRIACHPDVDNCLAYVYMNDHCADPVVAVAVFSITSGILSFTSVPGSGYDINAPIGGFSVVINESPVLSAAKK